jgi:hypothetical protein
MDITGVRAVYIIRVGVLDCGTSIEELSCREMVDVL